MKNPAKTLIIALLFLVSGNILAQENELLNRDFWRQQPNLATVKSTIAEGNDPTELNSNAFDAVVYALLENADTAVIAHLLSLEGNGVNKITHDGRTYIFWAAYANETASMKKLLAEGAKLEVKDTHGYTPLTFAANAGQTNPEIYELFEEYGVDISNEVNEHGANALLLIAPYVENLSELKYFLSKDLKLESKDNAGNGIFNYAAKNGNISLLEELIEKGIDYKYLNSDGGNAFLFAAQGSRGHSNSIEIYEFLKTLGLDPAMVTNTGYTPLHRLSYSAEKEIIKFFLDNGVEADQKDEEGNTPFLNAASRNSLEVVKLLAENVENKSHANEEGQSALMMAVKYNDPDITEYLLKQNFDAGQTDSAGNNLAYYLFTSNSKRDNFDQKLQLLKNENIDFTAEQENGNNLYHIVTASGDMERLEMLLELDVAINVKNDNGLTPLHIAAMKAKNDEMLKYLIAQGADASIKTDFEESVYDLASENEMLTKNNVELKFLQ